MWNQKRNGLRRDIQEVNRHDMLAYLGRNQKEVLHSVNQENKSDSK